MKERLLTPQASFEPAQADHQHDELHRDDPQHDERQDGDEEGHVSGHPVADLLHGRRSRAPAARHIP